MLHFSSSKYNIKLVKERAYQTNENYIERSKYFENPLIIKLIEEYKNVFTSRKNNINIQGKLFKKPTPLCVGNLKL
jgi:hypothetical protein